MDQRPWARRSLFIDPFAQVYNSPERPLPLVLSPVLFAESYIIFYRSSTLLLHH